MDLTALQALQQFISPNRQTASASPVMQPQQSQAPQMPPISQNGSISGLSIPDAINSALTSQSLPWLSPIQNATSIGSSVAQGAGSPLAASALSLLSSFLV